MTFSIIQAIIIYLLSAINEGRASQIDFDQNCTLLRNNFAEWTSNFSKCAIYNARPITLCENCIESYINVITSYKNMTELSANGTYCIDNLINLDRLQIVQTLLENSQNLWNKAKCYECFEIVDGSLTTNKSIETVKFRNHYNNLMNCVNRSDINSTTLCTVCMDDYLSLDNYYVSISNENERIGVCMDIVDLMNTTRTFWSQHCCEYRKHSEYLFICSACFVLIATLSFYVLAQFCSEAKRPTILQQTRFAGSLTQMNNS